MIVNRKFKFIFVHIPKTAGTSIRKVLGELPGRDTCVVADTKHETPLEFIQAYSNRCGRNSDELREYLWIMYVRHPIDRFASLHRYLLQKHRKKYPSVPFDVNDFAKLLTSPPQ